MDVLARARDVESDRSGGTLRVLPRTPVRPRGGSGWARRWGRRTTRVLVGLAVIAVVWTGVDLLVSDDDVRTETQMIADAIENSDDGRPEDAVAILTEVIRLDPSERPVLVRAYVERSFAFGVLGRHEEAIADASEAIGLGPDDPVLLAQAYLNRAFALGELGRHEEAIADASEAIGLGPDDPVLLAQAYVTRSWDLAVRGSPYEAIADASVAIGLRPDDPVVLAKAFLHRSFALSDLGRLDEASADASSAAAALPDGHELSLTVQDWLTHLHTRPQPGDTAA